VSSHGSHTERDGCGGNAAPYVLGALTDEEHEVFSNHIESCVVCREEVAALQIVVAALPAAAPQVQVPAELKRRVMSSVREDARHRRGEAMDGRSAARRSAFSLAAPFARPRRRLGVAVAALAAAAVALAVIALALGRGGGAGGGAARVIRAQVLAPRANATLNVSHGHAQLNIAGMPQSAPGRVYEVWIKRSAYSSPRPTDALFTVTTAGDATVAVPGGVAGVREVLVTSEPRGGSSAPTRTPVIIARVS
jgi:anti-sigma-K factor RskA